MGGAYEIVGVGEVPEERVDGPVVGDVVAAVGLRRGVEGREPDGVDAQLGEVRQPLGGPAQIADAVAVAVGEGAHVHLVDDGVAPPAAERAAGWSRRMGASSWVMYVPFRSADA